MTAHVLEQNQVNFLRQKAGKAVSNQPISIENGSDVLDFGAGERRVRGSVRGCAEGYEREGRRAGGRWRGMRCKDREIGGVFVFFTFNYLLY